MTDVIGGNSIKAFEALMRLGTPGYALALQTHPGASEAWLHVYRSKHEGGETLCGDDMTADTRAQWHTLVDCLALMGKGSWCPLCVSLANGEILGK